MVIGAVMFKSLTCSCSCYCRWESTQRTYVGAKFRTRESGDVTSVERCHELSCCRCHERWCSFSCSFHESGEVLSSSCVKVLMFCLHVMICNLASRTQKSCKSRTEQQCIEVYIVLYSALICLHINLISLLSSISSLSFHVSLNLTVLSPYL